MTIKIFNGMNLPLYEEIVSSNSTKAKRKFNNLFHRKKSTTDNAFSCKFLARYYDFQKSCYTYFRCDKFRFSQDFCILHTCWKDLKTPEEMELKNKAAYQLIKNAISKDIEINCIGIIAPFVSFSGKDDHKICFISWCEYTAN